MSDTGKWVAGCCSLSMVVFLVIIAALELTPMLTHQSIGSQDLGLPFTGYIANTCCAMSGFGVMLGIIMLLLSRKGSDADDSQ